MHMMDAPLRESRGMVNCQLPNSLHNTHSMPCKVMMQGRRPSVGMSASLRDKFAKFKDASFRLTRQSSGLHIVDDSTELEAAPTRRRKSVRFDMKRNQVQLFELTDVPNEERWWSSDELNTSRCDGKLSATVEVSVQEYCRAYERAYRQVHTDRKLTTAYLADLVKGLTLGYRGLEQYSASNKRKVMIREHVTSVIKCHRDRGSSTSSLNDSNHSLNSNSTAGSRNTSLERAVRNHSAKLSAGNRHFAVAMAKAEGMAAAADEANLAATAA